MVEASKKKIIITGAGGILGSALYDYFKCREAKSCVSTDIIGLFHQDCDIANKNHIEEKIFLQKPDIVINSAALTKVDYCQKHPKEAERINAKAVRNLALICRDLNCLLVHISTDYVFDGSKNFAYTEDDLANPISIYAETKLKGETAILKVLKRFFIVRTSWIFGKKNADFVSMVINRIRDKIPLKIANDKFSMPTYNYDLTKAIEDLILKSEKYGIYNITNQGKCSWYEFAKKIAEFYLNKDVEITPISINDLGFIAERPRNTILDNSKFYGELGYKLRFWQDALKEYIEKCYKN